MKYPSQAPTANIPNFDNLIKRYPPKSPNNRDPIKQYQVVESGDSLSIIKSRENSITAPAANNIPDINRVNLIILYPNKANINPRIHKIGTKIALFSLTKSVNLPKSAFGHPSLAETSTII